MLRTAAAVMRPGGRVVYVTSHQAHFSETHPVPAGYEPIAASKLAGERALRALAAEEDLDLRVVSGDMIEGTIIVRLLERRDPAAVEERRSHGPLPTVSEFAAAIAGAADAGKSVASTTYVGGRDYLG